jgi:DNA-binding LacI/PurR family transcriptional regulator
LLEKKAVTLRTVAERVGLAPCSVSAVLNNTPASWAIPQRTKDRVFRAAAQLDYRPNLSARSLRTKRTHMVAVVSPDCGQPSVARAVAGMESSLRRKGYLLILAAFERSSDWARIAVELQQRGIEGVIAVGMNEPGNVEMPVVSVDMRFLSARSLSARELLAEEVSVWLTDLGESAVEAMLRMIETKDVPRKATIAPKIPAALVNFDRAEFEELRDVS